MRLFIASALAALALALPASSAFAGNGDTYNLRISPITLAFGYVAATLDIATSESWTVGPTAGYWHLNLDTNNNDFSSKFDINKYYFGIRTNWFANGTYSNGFYFAPNLTYENVKLNTTRTNGESINGSASGLVIGALVGYSWFWNTFNIMLGLGYGKSLSEDKIYVTNAQGQTTSQNALGGLDGEFSFGWTF